MDTQSYKTRSAKPAEVQRKWFVIDAQQAVVGRLASRVATILRGKHKPTYTPHVDTGDYVIIINADQVRFTGSKEDDKLYYSYSGYPGGLKTRSARVMRSKKPEFLVRHAVKGMLPKGPLGRQMLTKLKVYAGPEHPHTAQAPEDLSFSS
ncbi:MAG: 50S ribosomal protein L13 [Bacteroidetes bacterium]|nr:50S ribosomal protein L13 [Bacteroidota bacterium]MCY4224441.1 50S ribosomal protein L13 [Bacteroidota bacterium]